MRRATNKSRSGATVVEFAFVAPILFSLVFAGLEYSRMNMLWGTTVNAAYEGARRGIVPGASAGDVEERVNSILKIVHTRDAQVTITPSEILPTTEEVTVEVAVPMDSNSWLAAVFFRNKIVRSQCTLDRDLIETNVVE